MADNRSGQITVTTAGTAVSGPASPLGREFILTPDPDNTGEVFVGNDGADDVTVDNGFVIKSGVALRVNVRYSLEELYFDSEQDGDKIHYFKVL